MRPYYKKCQKYCDDYPCTKSHCARKVGWKWNGELTMLSTVETIRANTFHKKQLHEPVRLNEKFIT